MTYSWVEAYSNSVLLLSGTDPMTLPLLMASTICTSRAIRHSVILCCGKRWSDISKPRTPSLCPSLVSSCGVQSHQPKTLSSSAIKQPPIKAFFLSFCILSLISLVILVKLPVLRSMTIQSWRLLCSCQRQEPCGVNLAILCCVAVYISLPLFLCANPGVFSNFGEPSLTLWGNRLSDWQELSVGGWEITVSPIGDLWPPSSRSVSQHRHMGGEVSFSVVIRPSPFGLHSRRLWEVIVLVREIGQRVMEHKSIFLFFLGTCLRHTECSHANVVFPLLLTGSNGKLDRSFDMYAFLFLLYRGHGLFLWMCQAVADKWIKYCTGCISVEAGDFQSLFANQWLGSVLAKF